MRIRKFGVLFVFSFLIAGLAFATLALADAPPRTTDWSTNPPTADSLVVGVPYEDAYLTANSGVIQLIYGYRGMRIFDNLSTSEYFGQTSSAGSVETDDYFGKSVAVADFNRDGYYDIAVGVPGEDDATDSNIGAVNILYGSETGFVTQSYIGYDAIGAAGDQFGAALATGDFNGDGVPDLAVGVPGYDYPHSEGSVDTDAGAVYVFWGLNSGLMTSTTTVYYGDDAYGYYGAALAAADFNGDGHDELVIGAPDHSTPAPITDPARGGTFYVLTLFNNNQTEWNQTSASGDGAEDGDQFGASFAVGDFNGDGHPDLAIGAPGEDWEGNSISLLDVGAVSVMYNDGSGLSATDALFLWQSDVSAGWNPHNTSEALDQFGYTLTGGDFNGDGFDDLAIGTPYENLTIDSTDYTDIGLVQLVPGSTTGITPTYQSLDVTIFEPAQNQYRGYSLAAGDFNTDGTTDIAIGLPGYTTSGGATSAGAVQFCYKISTSVYSTSITCSSNPYSQADLPGVAAEDYDRFGWALATLPAPLTNHVYLPLILR